MVSWQQGRIKRGGGFNYSSPPDFFGRKVKKRYKEDEKWMGREVVVPVNIFLRGDIFSGGVKIFSGGVVEKFSRGQMLEPPPPPGNLSLFL